MLKYFFFLMFGLTLLAVVFLGPPVDELYKDTDYIRSARTRSYKVTVEPQSYIECGDFSGGYIFKCQFTSLENDPEDNIYKVVCEDGTLAMLPKTACMVFFKRIKIVSADEQ